MRHSGGLVMVVLVTVACGRGSSAQGGAADSTAAPIPPAAAPAAESIATPVMSAGPVKEPRKSVDSIIGWDSAYGPKFTVDSTGKIVPIVKKKP
jgi:hypothetical protein